MPRSGGGVYTLPSAAFIPLTTISSAAVNADFSDIATALTGSLATNGSSAMSAPLRLAAGTTALPSLTFTGSVSNGLSLSGANQVAMSNNGIVTQTWNADNSTTVGALTTTGAIVAGAALTLPAGALGTPSLLFAGSPTTGAFKSGADAVSFVNAGVVSQIWNANGSVTIPNLIAPGFGAPPLYQVKYDAALNRIMPYGGNQIGINGTNYTVPNAGFGIQTSFGANVVGYIYAYITGGVTVGLEASTTPPVFGAFGCKIKTGDPSRTLVAMAWSQNPGAGQSPSNNDGFTGGAARQQIIGYFNRSPMQVSAFLGGGPQNQPPGTWGGAVPTSVQAANGIGQIQFITWADTPPTYSHLTTATTSDGANVLYYASVYEDYAGGSSVTNTYGVRGVTQPSSNSTPSTTIYYSHRRPAGAVSEGVLHTLDLFVASNGINGSLRLLGTPTVETNTAGGTFITVEVMG